MREQGEQEGAVHTALGVPMLVITVDEVRSPILTTCGLPVRKSKIHLHREVLSPRSTSLEMSLEGMMVLNAEL